MMVQALQLLLHTLHEARRLGRPHSFVHLSHHREPHRHVKPIQKVLCEWVQVHRQIPYGLAAIAEKRHRLIGVHPLRFQNFEQPPLGFGVVGIYKGEALGGSLSRYALADDYFEPTFLPAALLTTMHIAAIQSHCQGCRGIGQKSFRLGG
jgi:hypothetical protein